MSGARRGGADMGARGSSEMQVLVRLRELRPPRVVVSAARGRCEEAAAGVARCLGGRRG